jgi:hypothetical protein
MEEICADKKRTAEYAENDTTIYVFNSSPAAFKCEQPIGKFSRRGI